MPSFLQSGVDMAPQFTHSRPSPGNSSRYSGRDIQGVRVRSGQGHPGPGCPRGPCGRGSLILCAPLLLCKVQSLPRGEFISTLQSVDQPPLFPPHLNFLIFCSKTAYSPIPFPKDRAWPGSPWDGSGQGTHQRKSPVLSLHRPQSGLQK